MHTTEWRKFLIPYENAVEELKVKFKSIRTELRTIGEYSPIEFVTGRVKRVSSIIEKAKKLEVENEDIAEKIEDIAGIRIMCQFVEDIYTVVDYIRERDGSDLDIVYEKDYITNYKESGYRSYHIIINYPIQTALGPKVILAEIQIRTLAMNFWATIEHSLKYKYKQNIPIHIEGRIKKAADAAFKLDQEMSGIRHEIRQAQKMFEVRSKTISNILRNIHALQKAGRTKEVIEFQAQFNKVWENTEVVDLKKLDKEISNFIDEIDGIN
ncbi:GTP pyrophosphokinase family protein [Serpentinicella sp. ANB-PHB4]|uniref:GTP pyrophosphokinase n=1 Tax=Serpentinicella sp. ANB-PHB4 TaxID=3074076 RepID=UPI002862A590|nr:GTP pyrophosphokinase family protein [Serpentinicella sp. ANB-PHB4]MDR5658534.1 GTP pyrophosphokinase family protein [Serpentinicella sp. ANB-PHB4]